MASTSEPNGSSSSSSLLLSLPGTSSLESKSNSIPRSAPGHEDRTPGGRRGAHKDPPRRRCCYRRVESAPVQGTTHEARLQVVPTSRLYSAKVGELSDKAR